jgi:hypothetical protein
MKKRISDSPDYVSFFSASYSSEQTLMMNALPHLNNCPDEEVEEFLKKNELWWPIESSLKEKKEFYVRIFSEEINKGIAEKDRIFKENKKIFKKNKNDTKKFVIYFQEISPDVNAFLNKKSFLQRVVGSVKGKDKTCK